MEEFPLGLFEIAKSDAITVEWQNRVPALAALHIAVRNATGSVDLYNGGRISPYSQSREVNGEPVLPLHSTLSLIYGGRISPP